MNEESNLICVRSVVSWFKNQGAQRWKGEKLVFVMGSKLTLGGAKSLPKLSREPLMKK